MIDESMYAEYLAGGQRGSVPALPLIIQWADALFDGGFRLLQDDLCLPEFEEDWSERDRQIAYIAIGESVERARQFLAEEERSRKRLFPVE